MIDTKVQSSKSKYYVKKNLSMLEFKPSPSVRIVLLCGLTALLLGGFVLSQQEFSIQTNLPNVYSTIVSNAEDNRFVKSKTNVGMRDAPAGFVTDQETLEFANRQTTISNFARAVKRDEDSFVTVTFSSYSYRDSLINWLLAMERVKMRSIALVCLDQTLKQFLADRGVPCFDAYSQEATSTKNDTDLNIDDEPNQVNEDMKKLTRREVHGLWTLRLRFLSELLHAGIDVLFSDLDVILAQDPRPLFKKADVVASRGLFPPSTRKTWGGTICMGFIYFKSTSQVLQVVERAIEIEITEDRDDDQVIMNLAFLEAFGPDPLQVFGTRADLKLPWHAISKVEGQLKLLLLSHVALPRFCKDLPFDQWNSDIIGAHCRLPPNERKKNDKGDEGSRNLAMERYDLFCDTEALKGQRASKMIVSSNKAGQESITFLDPNPEVFELAALAPSGHAEFAFWLKENSRTCDFINFASKPGAQDFSPPGGW